MDEKKRHWETTYKTKSSEKLSWTQDRPTPSIDWIIETTPARDAAIIDVGGGTSHLVDHLLDADYGRPTVLDISSAAIEQARFRLGKREALVDWIESDIVDYQPLRKFSLWHDRAVFHFLTRREDREKYIETLKNALLPEGKIILATFSPHGPGQCSGLDVMRFDEGALASELGSSFKLLRSERRIHATPWGTSQEFVYCCFIVSKQQA
jgi:SAM-dependent methyltransferase